MQLGLFTPTVVAWVQRSSASVILFVCLSVCPRDKTKTAETKIAKLCPSRYLAHQCRGGTERVLFAGPTRWYGFESQCMPIFLRAALVSYCLVVSLACFYVSLGTNKMMMMMMMMMTMIRSKVKVRLKQSSGRRDASVMHLYGVLLYSCYCNI